MDAEELKIEAMCWLRYGRRMPIVCSEAGRWNADVLGVSPNQCIEVEVKLSKSDLNAEFRYKAAKHFLYANAETSGRLAFVPNQFYFMVPAILAQVAQEIVAAQAPKAGIIEYQPDNNLLDGRNCVVIKPAEKLKDGKPSRALIRVAMMRMSSELCGTHLVAHRAIHDLKTRFWNELEKVRTTVVRSAGTLDMEDATADLDCRASELAQCVDGLNWKILNEEQRGRWRDAAKKLLSAQYLDLDKWEIEASL